MGFGSFVLISLYRFFGDFGDFLFGYCCFFKVWIWVFVCSLGFGFDVCGADGFSFRLRILGWYVMSLL